MLEIRPATSDEDLAHIARIVCTVTPDFPTSVTEIRWSEQAYPGGRRFLAWLDGEPVGSGGVGRMYIYPPEFGGLWGNAVVLPLYRRQGVGGAILATIAGATRAAGKTALARGWRGRGVASALKRATVAWATANGLEALETANDTDNAPMRAVNLRLGYQPRPDEIYYRGPVAEA